MKYTQTVIFVIAAAVSTMMGGCASYSRVQNIPMTETYQLAEYYDNKFYIQSEPGDMFLALSFSGGGTRAAAFSYGVLKELNETFIIKNNQEQPLRLLDEVDHISSVSGGSFTAAYYGLFKDRIFEDYEDVFLRNNVQKTLINSFFYPINWFKFLFSRFDRGAVAIDYYDRQIFREKTFRDMAATPFIQINATDLGTGLPFSFTPEAFATLCSDLNEFKIARAVAASSAVPVAFTPVTLQNHDGCEADKLRDVVYARKENNELDIRTKAFLKDLASFADKERRPFIHLVDGGISDNLGIRPMILRILFLKELQEREAPERPFRVPENFAMIVVNAQTSPERKIEQSPDAPSSIEVMNAVSGAQIKRDNLQTLIQARKLFQDATEVFAEKGQPLNTYFIELRFEDIPDFKTRTIFNNMATSFSLPDDQVDMLVESGRQLLRESPEFKRLLKQVSKK